MSKLTQQEIDSINSKIDAIRSVMNFELVRSDSMVYPCLVLAFEKAERAMREQAEAYIRKNKEG